MVHQEAVMKKKVWNNSELLDHSCVYIMHSEIGADGEANVPFLLDCE